MLYGYYICNGYDFRFMKREGLSLKEKTNKGIDKNKNVLVALTEGPHYDLKTWANNLYEDDGLTKKVIKGGIYSEKIWKNIIFQIFSLLLVFQKLNLNYKISIENLFIRDLNTNKYKPVNYWKYIIDKKTFFVPNYGYLVLFNSRFLDNDMNFLNQPNLKIKKKFMIIYII